MQKETSLKSFQVISRLGQGAFGQVYKVKRKSDNNIYALKKIKTAGLKQKDRINTLNQIRILASITGQNIIGYKNSFYDEQSNDLCIVLQYAGQGDIFQKVKNCKKENKMIEQQQIWKAMVHIAKGLRILHRHNVLHRDLKSANIFITDEGVYKLADLNISKILKQNLAQTQTGTPYYCSPEIWKETPYDSKCDIWSLGCVLYEMASGKPPFIANSIQQLYKKICNGLFPPIPNTYSDQLTNKITSFLNLNPKKRPSAQQILKCPIVNKNYQGVNLQQIPPNILMQTINLNQQGWKYINQSLPKSQYQIQILSQNQSPSTNFQESQNIENQDLKISNKSFILRIPKPNRSSRPTSSKSDKKQYQRNVTDQNQSLEKNVSAVYTKDKIQKNIDSKRVLSCEKVAAGQNIITTPQKSKIGKRILLPPINPASRSRKNSENIQNYKPPSNIYRITNRSASKQKKSVINCQNSKITQSVQ